MFGMRADADNAYGYSPSYPMATRFVPANILEAKWALVHGAAPATGRRANERVDRSGGARPLRPRAGKKYLGHRPGGRGQDHLDRRAHRPSGAPARSGSGGPPVAADRRDLLGARGPADAAEGARGDSGRGGFGAGPARLSADFLRHDPQLLRPAARTVRALSRPAVAGGAARGRRRIVEPLSHPRPGAGDFAGREPAGTLPFLFAGKALRAGQGNFPRRGNRSGTAARFGLAALARLSGRWPPRRHEEEHRPRPGGRDALERGLGEGRTLSAPAEVSRVGESGGLRRNLERDVCPAPRLAARARRWLSDAASPMPTRRSACPRR